MSTGMVALIAAVSSLTGAFLGFLLGRLTQATVGIEEKMKDSSTVDEASHPEQRRSRWPNTRMWLAILVVTMSLSTVALGIVLAAAQGAAVAAQKASDERADRLIACLGSYSDALGDALETRAGAGQAATEQLDIFMNAVVKVFDNPDPATRQALIDAAKTYVDKRDDVKEALKENPYPEVPRNACAELRR